MIFENREIELVIIEDDPNDTELLMRMFHKHGVTNKIHLLRDGAEALDFMFARGVYAQREMHYETMLIILDLKLPKVNGIEVLEQLKSDKRTKAIPIVILSGSRENKDVQDAYRFGVSSYVTKPIKFDEFAKVVSELEISWLMLGR